MSIQTDIDSLIGGVSVFNLALNVAGIINNKRNVSLYAISQQNGKVVKINILEGSLSRLSGITNIANKIDGTGVVLSADIVEDSKLTEHPLENGKVLADNKVILPTEINVKVTLQAIDYQDMLSKIKAYYKQDNQMIYVETKFGGYNNMQIVGLPCNLNVENINRLTFTIKLRQVLVMTEQNRTTNDNDMDTINTGTQTGVLKTLNSVVFG